MWRAVNRDHKLTLTQCFGTIRREIGDTSRDSQGGHGGRLKSVRCVFDSRSRHHEADQRSLHGHEVNYVLLHDRYDSIESCLGYLGSFFSGGSSVVECLLAKEKVAGSSPVHRS